MVRGASPVKTISLRDFSFPIVYAAAKGKSQAIAGNQALVELLLATLLPAHPTTAEQGAGSRQQGEGSTRAPETVEMTGAC